MDRRRRTRPPARPTTPNREVRVRVDKVVAEGDGLARDESGKIVFVEGALPGELVSAHVIAESKDYSRAVVSEVLESHERRVSPPCPHVIRGCGGCDLQHADEDLQIAIKRDIVEESLRRLGGLASTDVRVRRTVDSSKRLRTTVRVASGRSGVGFRRRRSREVVAIDSCRVAHPRVNEVISEIELALDAEAVIRVSGATGQATVWAEPPLALVKFPSDVGTGPDAAIREVVAGVELHVSAASFFQSSPGAAETLAEAVAEALGDPSEWPEGPVIDAYGGVGLFAATVVPADRRVVVVEANPSSCADARRNLAGRAADVVEGRVEDWKACPAAVVIADPARDGLRARAADVLTSSRPSVLVLVSCDPASLGRDAKLLAARGYRLAYSEVLDVFPHTHHVEAVSRFVRSDAPEVP